MCEEENIFLSGEKKLIKKLTKRSVSNNNTIKL